MKPKITVPKAAKRLILHTLLFVPAFMLMGKLPGMFLGFIELMSVQLLGFMAILGCVHLWALYRFHDWTQEQGLIWEAVFTCSINLVGGAAFFIVVYQNSELTVYAALLFLATCFFSLPFFVDKTLALHMAIPSKTYPAYFTLDEWSAKLSMVIEENDMGLEWSFEGSVGEDMPKETVRIFAPVNVQDIQFGKLFEAFLLWHNTRLNPGNPVKVAERNEQGEIIPYNWEFFHRRYWFSPWLSRIDPSLTVAENRLRFVKRRSKIDPSLEVKAPLIYVRRFI